MTAAMTAAVPNALRVPCSADALRTVRCAAELADCLGDAARRGMAATVIGGGTNVVLRERLPGLALLFRSRGVRFERLAARRWRVRAAGGENWHALVRATLRRGIAGLENLALIPGSVGAAPVQNIGAYGRELAQVLESVTVYDRRRGAFATLTAAECRLAYRHSRFKAAPARWIVTEASLLLGDVPAATGYPDVRRELARRQRDDATPIAIAAAVARARRRKLPDPRRVANVGSFFTNPLLAPQRYDALRAKLDIDGFASGGAVKVSAARLIDSAGWKGFAIGAVQVWPRQPLVLVNRGGARGSDVLDLARRIRDDVAAKYGVLLEIEPTVLGVDRRQPVAP